MNNLPRHGRHLGFSVEERRTRTFAKFWNPAMAPLPGHAVAALNHGPLAEALLPPACQAAQSLFGDGHKVENGYALAGDGGIRVVVRTDMPGVTPDMVDWWFGWHGDDAAKYKLWHPLAHVHAAWKSPQPPGARGRAAYLGNTSFVDEYIGSRLLTGAIQFVEPRALGLTEPTLNDPAQAMAVCARTGLAAQPVDVGYLVHHVRAVPGGSEMRSRFWLGGRDIAGRSPLGAAQAALARRFLKIGEGDARALLIHCAQEMQHLASFLPAMFREYADGADQAPAAGCA